MSDGTPIAWTEVRVLAPLGWHELVADAIALEPCTSVVLGRPSLGSPEAPQGFDYVRTFLPDRADTPEVRATLERALAALAVRAAVPELEGLEVAFKRLPPEDYATSWKKSWKPFRVGRLSVVPPGFAGRSRADDVRLTLEPGGAFGTGRHATTRTCLKVLQERPVAGARVLDAGSGSGILAVAAVRLGAREVHGFDVDPNALAYARDLARQNDVVDACHFVTGDFDSAQPVRAGAEPFDVVLANIYSDVIQANAARLRALLHPDGWFAASGCPAHHRDPTRAALEAAGLDVEEERVRGRWHTFVGSAGVAPAR